VASLNRPGGNITGVNTFNAVLGAKRFELLHKLVPNATVIALLNSPTGEPETRETQAVACALGHNLIVLHAHTGSEIDVAFATVVQRRVGALIVTGDPSFVSRRDKIVALEARHAVPTIYTQREFVAAGGLIGYETSITDAYRQAGIYTGRILNGLIPADLPVMQSTKFEFLINLNTARAFGLSFPPGLLAIADEVIDQTRMARLTLLGAVIEASRIQENFISRSRAANATNRAVSGGPRPAAQLANASGGS
jgi:putative tryptophan/tyrosine transport system substrate-binding protein